MGCESSKVRSPTISIRVALVGRKGSGKSSLLSAFLHKKGDCAPSLSSQIGVKAYSFRDSSAVTTLEVWEISHDLVVRDFNVVLLVLDAALTSAEISEDISKYTEILRTQGKLGIMSVAVTKADAVGSPKEVLKRRVLENCRTGPFPRVYVTSAKTQSGIEEMFRDFAQPRALSRSVSRRTSIDE